MDGTAVFLTALGAREEYGDNPTNEDCGYEECGSCGADVGRSSDYPWHYPWEDCRATRNPINNQEVR